MSWVKKIPGPILLLVGPFGMIIKAAQLITDNWEKVLSVFKRVFNILSKVAKVAKDVVASGIGKLAGALGLDRIGATRAQTKGGAASENEGGVIDRAFSSVLGKLDGFLSKVEVKFANEPPGTQVRTEDDAGILSVERGLATAGT